MPKIDEVKEFIGFLKAIFVTAVIIVTSLMAWAFKNFETEAEYKIYIVLGLIIMLSLFIYIMFIKILKEIKSLKDL